MNTKKKILAAASLLALSLAGSPLAQAAITINSPGVVGVHDGALANSNVDTERTAGQKLLDMLKSTTDGNFTTSDTEYTGTLVGGIQTTTGASGWDWGLAKYDGQNAGYVLFFLNGALASTIVPQLSDTIWTNISGQGYGLSHLTVFNETVPGEGETPGVPDGGSSIALFGLGLTLLAVARRRLA